MKLYGRRDFLKAAGLTLAAAASAGVLTACGDSGQVEGGGGNPSSSNGTGSSSGDNVSSSGSDDKDPDSGKGDSSSSETPNSPTQVKFAFKQINGTEARFLCLAADSADPIGTVEIPSEWNGLRVTKISDVGLKGCRNITKLILPKELREIEHHAFADCTALKEIVFPDTVEIMGMCAFMSCSSLRKVAIPKNERLYTLSNRLFSSCRSLKAIYIPKTITHIEENVFDSIQAEGFSVFYEGTEDEWKCVSIEHSGTGQFRQVTPYFNATKEQFLKETANL